MTGDAPFSALPTPSDVALWALAWRRGDESLGRVLADLDADEASAAIPLLLALVDAALLTSAGHDPDRWLRAVVRAADATS